MTVQALDPLLARFHARERGALARLLSVIENEPARASSVVSAIYSDTGTAQVVGVTGPPGSGKSTLVNALIGAYRTQQRSVGVLAVDPSSSFSGGATLGDRIRMLDRWDDTGVYIRSLATRGLLGGLSAAVHDATHLLDAFGFDVIIIETVGVGQAEVDISQVAQTVVLLQVPGLGDSVQTIKAGVLEIADILAVNKADMPGAHALVIDLRHMLRLAEQRAWTPPIVELTATTGDGVDRLVERISEHAAFLESTGQGTARTLLRARDDVLQNARRRLDRNLRAAVHLPELDALMMDVAARSVAPAIAVDEVLGRLAVAQAVSS